MYQQKAQDVLKAFCRLEKNTCLYITGKGKGYQKLKAMVSELHLEGRVILTGWLEKLFAFMNLCDYFICLEGEEESARLKVEMEPHEFMIMNESGDGTAMDITLNNYRVNKDEIIFENIYA